MNKLVLFLFSLFITFGLHAQVENNPLEGLQKINSAELGGQLMITPEVKVYNTQKEPIDNPTFFEFIRSGDYLPSAYVDENKNLKAIVLRPTTDEEKAKMKKMMGMAGKKELKEKKEALLPAQTTHVGEKVPDFKFTDLDGNTYTNENLAGKVAVLNFWFVNCKPCIQEIPELNEITHKYENHKDVVFIGIALDSSEKLNTFLEHTPFEYNIIPDGMKASSAFGVRSYPTNIVIGRDGNLVHRTIGFGENTILDLKTKIEESL